MPPESRIAEQTLPMDEHAEQATLPTHPANAVGIGSTALGEGLPQIAEAEPTREEKFAKAEQWLGAWNSANAEPLPVGIASEITIVAQRQMNDLEDEGVIDDQYTDLEHLRDEAMQAADELDFDLVRLSGNEWSFQTQLNAMHNKFKKVSAEDIGKFLGADESRYEYRALFIRDIINDHAPALLTENLRVLFDPEETEWRAASTHASILLGQRQRTNLSTMHVEQIPTALPIGGREAYEPEDDAVMKPLAEMNDEELAMYCRPEAMSAVRERGYAEFNELMLPARQTLLTRRLFEVVGKSHSKEMKDQASERNKMLEHEQVLQEGDLVHATPSPEVFESILTNGLRCGEAVMNNDRSTIKYPFTVSFLEVTPDIAQGDTVADRVSGLNNEPYGGINIVLNRDETATDTVRGQRNGVINQRQIFGGVPSTEVKSVVIRDEKTMGDELNKVVATIVKNKMFVPVYSGATGESLLTSEQFDQLVAAQQ